MITSQRPGESLKIRYTPQKYREKAYLS